ncbi:MAG: DsbA family protein [Alphaproteobacteria bacterium]
MGTFIRPVFLAALLLVGLGATPGLAEETAPAQDEAAIRKIVRDYLRENPEVIIEALKEYERREEDARQAEQAAAMEQYVSELHNDPASPDNGVVDPDVTLIEFFDYQCGYCKQMFPALADLMESDRKLKVIFKELPILGPASTFASHAALASRKQGRYLEFHTAMMQLRGKLTEEAVMNAAREVGLDTTRLATDMRDPAIREHLDRNRQIAEAIGVTGTPAMVVGATLVPGALDKSGLARLIEKVRAENS